MMSAVIHIYGDTMVEPVNKTVKISVHVTAPNKD